MGLELSMEEMNHMVSVVRIKKPVVQCITNFVTVNDCANVIHAIGAKPIMAHHPLEVEEVVAGVDALVCNLGATDDYEAMKIAVKVAYQLGKPVVINPVGVGAIGFRRSFCQELLALGSPTCIRGNASEIRALVEDMNTTRGVDVSTEDQRNGKNDFNQTAVYANTLAKKKNCIVVTSGMVDVITDGKETYHVTEGTEMLTRITGSGCMSTALIGAFLGAISMDAAKESMQLQACVAAGKVMGWSGERAELLTRKCSGGTMTFHDRLIDEISLLGEVHK